MKWQEVVNKKIDDAPRVFIDIVGCLVEVEKRSAQWLMKNVRKSDLSWCIDDDGDLVIEEVR